MSEGARDLPRPREPDREMPHQRAKDPAVTRVSAPDDISVELSARRTGMSFQRTRMSADRTLMSVMRTALSLIGFGFTLAQFFTKMRESGVLKSGARAAHHFGVTLVALGIGMLAFGILFHVQFMLGLRKTRREMKASGLIHGESVFPPSLTLVTAILLMIVGVVAIVSMTFGIGPFG